MLFSFFFRFSGESWFRNIHVHFVRGLWRTWHVSSTIDGFEQNFNDMGWFLSQSLHSLVQATKLVPFPRICTPRFAQHENSTLYRHRTVKSSRKLKFITCPGSYFPLVLSSWKRPISASLKAWHELSNRKMSKLVNAKDNWNHTGHNASSFAANHKRNSALSPSYLFTFWRRNRWPLECQGSADPSPPLPTLDEGLTGTLSPLRWTLHPSGMKVLLSVVSLETSTLTSLLVIL